MVELTRAKEEPHGTINKLSDYRKGKSLKLQKNRDNQRRNDDTMGRSGTQPNS